GVVVAVLAGGIGGSRFLRGLRSLFVRDDPASIVAVVNTAGTAVAINSYDPWGIPAAGNVGRYGYTGQTWIPELGLWYYKTRFYSPTTGRFLQVDPIGYDGGSNLYAYVGNDPVNFSDPTGLARICAQTTETGNLAPTTKCVDVDGDRNGKSRENDMTPKEMQRVRSSYKGFIQRFGAPRSGRVPDLAPYQKPIGGNGTASAKNMVSVISQFWGFLASRVPGMHWSSIKRVDVNQGPSRNAPAPAIWSSRDGIITFTGQALKAHPLQDIYSESYSDVGRIFIHEATHVWATGLSEFQVDTIARRRLNRIGMDGEGCAATNGFPAC
ncbi:MAG TPA: RHS repeat-associated core domain-containing protein, partial [Thermoanaerobaculia bacterium]